MVNIFTVCIGTTSEFFFSHKNLTINIRNYIFLTSKASLLLYVCICRYHCLLIQNIQNKKTNIKYNTQVNNSPEYVALVECVLCCRSFFVPFLLTILLSFLLRFMDSDYPFGIFKLFSWLSLVDPSAYTCTFPIRLLN